MRELKFRAWDRKHKQMFYQDHTDIQYDGKDYEYTLGIIVRLIHECKKEAKP